jgi:hypothetical protein
MSVQARTLQFVSRPRILHPKHFSVSCTVLFKLCAFCFDTFLDGSVVGSVVVSVTQASLRTYSEASNRPMRLPALFLVVVSSICLSLSVCPSVSLSLCLCLTVSLDIYLWLYSPYGPWPVLHFLNPRTAGRTPWTEDQPVARPLPTHRTTQTQNIHTQTSMPRVVFEPTIPVFERVKTVHALDRAPTVIGCFFCVRQQNRVIRKLKIKGKWGGQIWRYRWPGRWGPIHRSVMLQLRQVILSPGCSNTEALRRFSDNYTLKSLVESRLTRNAVN